MLRIEKENKIYFDGLPVNQAQVELKDFLIANFGVETAFGKDLTIEDLVHVFYPIREFIHQYFSEPYEVVRAFLTVTKFNQNYKKLRIYKTLTNEDGYLYISINVELIPGDENEPGVNSISKLPVFLDEKLEIADEDIELDRKMKFNLLDTMPAIFEDLSYILKNESVIAS